MNIIYTAISGGYDILKPHPPVKGCRFMAFVDDPAKYVSQNWELKKLIPFHQNPTRNSRKYKVLAHTIIPEANYSLWIDGSIEIKKGFNLNQMIAAYLGNHDMALFKHPRRSCAYEEAQICANRKLDNPSVIDKQMSKYRSEGYPPNNGLVETMMLLRRHTPAIAIFEDIWWKEICKGSRRDQLSFGYAMWKTKISCALLSGNPYRRNNTFKKYRHNTLRPLSP